MTEIKNTKVRIYGLLKVFVTVGILLLLVMKFSLSLSVLTKITTPSCLAISAAIVLFVVMSVSTNRWQVFLEQMGIKEKFWPLWKINIIAMFQGLILPSTQGADVIRMYHLAKRHPGQVGGASGSVLVERIFGVLIWCSVAVIGLPFVLKYVETKWTVLFAVLGFFFAAIVGTVLVMNRRIHTLYEGRRPRIKLLAKVVSVLDSIHSSLIGFPYLKVLGSSIVLILVCQMAAIVNVWLIFMAYGVSLPFYMHMAFYPVIAIIAMMPVTIGGFGVREGAFAYFYSLVGVPVEVAVSVSVVNYVFVTLIPAAIGALLCGWDQIINVFMNG